MLSVACRKQVINGDHGLYGRGVSRESTTILGEVWRSLTLGELHITEQRFVVVKGYHHSEYRLVQIDFHSLNLRLSLNNVEGAWPT